MPTVFTEAMNLGDLLKFEAPSLYSRDRVTVAAGQYLQLGTVLGIVTASGKYKQIDPSAEDGSQVAAGVLLQTCDATLADRDNGLVSDHALQWPEAITAAEKASAIAQLKALGVLVRQGV
jgi:hypothetical protein